MWYICIAACASISWCQEIYLSLRARFFSRVGAGVIDLIAENAATDSFFEKLEVHEKVGVREKVTKQTQNLSGTKQKNQAEEKMNEAAKQKNQAEEKMTEKTAQSQGQKPVKDYVNSATSAVGTFYSYT